MTAQLDSLSKRLLKTRDNLSDVCEEMGLEQPEESLLGVMQCVNCSLWQLKRYIIVDENVPVCTFCTDLTLLRF